LPLPRDYLPLPGRYFALTRTQLVRVGAGAGFCPDTASLYWPLSGHILPCPGSFCLLSGTLIAPVRGPGSGQAGVGGRSAVVVLCIWTLFPSIGPCPGTILPLSGHCFLLSGPGIGQAGVGGRSAHLQGLGALGLCPLPGPGQNQMPG
jgi:hypothetical protein